MRNGSSPTFLWWVFVLRRLVVILGVVTLVLVAVAALGLLLFFLWVEFTTYFQSGAKLPFSSDHTAISTAIATLVASIFAVSGVAAAVVGFLYAKRQYLMSQKIARSDFLLRLDEAFERHKVVGKKLAPGGEWYKGKDDSNPPKGPKFPADTFDVVRYMGLFERIKKLVDEGVVRIDTVYRLYGYRFYNVIRNPIILEKRLKKNTKGWSDFILLWQAIENERKASGGLLPEGLPKLEELLHLQTSADEDEEDT